MIISSLGVFLGSCHYLIPLYNDVMIYFEPTGKPHYVVNSAMAVDFGLIFM